MKQSVVVFYQRGPWLPVLAGALIALCTVAGQVAADEQDCVPWRPDYLIGTHTRVGEIAINRIDVFDISLPKESRWFHKLTNKLHTKTRESVIRSQLLFRKGDVFSTELLHETERLLRSNRYIREANIKPTGICGEVINIQVDTADNWTLTPSISFKRAGGVNSHTFEIQDLNFLGRGKELKYSSKTKGDLTENIFLYKDRNLLGGRHILTLAKSDTDEGKGYEFELGLPFFSLGSQHSWHLGLADDESLLRNYTTDSSQPILSRTQMMDLAYSRKVNNTGPAVYRFGSGVRYEREKIVPDAGIAAEVGQYDFEYTYPYFALSYLLQNYIELENLYAIGRTEDIAIGTRAGIGVGLIAGAFGNENQQFKLDLEYGRGWKIGQKSLLLLDLAHTSFLGSASFKKYKTKVQLDAFHYIDASNQLQLHLNMDQLTGYSTNHFLSVGGEFGLRGYPDKYQTGNKRVIGSIEFRHFYSWYPWRLFRTAVSVFYETGAAWARSDERQTLQNIGVGLVLAPTRSSSHNILRFDISVPVSGDRETDAYQLYIGSEIVY